MMVASFFVDNVRKTALFPKKAFDTRCMLSTTLLIKLPCSGGIIVLRLESVMEVYIEYAIIDNLIIDYVLRLKQLRK